MLVSPAHLTVAASQVGKVQRLQIENRGSARLHISTRLEAVSQHADGSTLVEPDAPYSAVKWVTVMPDHFEVRTRTRRYVQVRFRVPSNAEPGNHNVAIIFMQPPVAAKTSNNHGARRSSLRIAEGIGVPALITVPGPSDRRRAPHPPQSARILGRRPDTARGDDTRIRRCSTTTS